MAKIPALEFDLAPITEAIEEIIRYAPMEFRLPAHIRQQIAQVCGPGADLVEFVACGDGRFMAHPSPAVAGLLANLRATGLVDQGGAA